MGLTHPVTSKVVENDGDETFRVGTASMQGYRLNMEDASSVVLKMQNHPNTSFFGVFDGHGGGDASKFCEAEVAKRLDQLENITRENIHNTVMQVDGDFLNPDNASRQHGSTAVFAVVEKTSKQTGSENSKDSESDVKFQVTIANVGDSRCLCGKIPEFCGESVNPNSEQVLGAEYTALTEDHKPSDVGERTRISRAGGFVEMGRVVRVFLLTES